MGTRARKDRLFEGFAAVGKALGRRRRVRARRLEDGFPQWRRAGLPVAVGAEGHGDGR